MKFKALVSLLTASMALVAHSAFASNYLPCDGCNYAQQSAAALAHGVGSYVVGDVLGNHVNAFLVSSSYHQNSMGGGAASAVTRKLYVEERAIAAPEAAAFVHLVAFYNMAPVGYQKTYNVRIVDQTASKSSLNANSAAFPARSEPFLTPPATVEVHYPDPGINAYTVINGGPLQNAFLEWAGRLTQSSITSAIANLVNAPTSTSEGAAPWAVSLTVYFTDNSHISVYVDITQQPAAILVNPKSAVDSHDNNIPASQSAVAGTGQKKYEFDGRGNSTDRQNMAAQITAFGISVPSSSTGVGYACASRTKGLGVTITCRAL